MDVRSCEFVLKKGQFCDNFFIFPLQNPNVTFLICNAHSKSISEVKIVTGEDVTVFSKVMYSSNWNGTIATRG